MAQWSADTSCSRIWISSKCTREAGSWISRASTGTCDNVNRDPIRTAARAARRRDRLRGATTCLICGEPELVKLTPASKGLLEFHHIAGRNNDPHLGVALCRNCHAKLTESQLRADIHLIAAPERSVLVRHADAHDARAIFFEDLAEAERHEAAELRDVAALLDQARSQAEA